ncbi:MAG: AAA family ATPase [Gammaproteobacteria bacterium RIFCSPHIGHO2_12_FULL_41_15]|nr:MAG: AAA family ATPase [Gammaproteobacteria bacterium RIFCSPHIGHO2_12_FULL_41_15]
MYRKSFDYLESWLAKKARKPLVIRGARQVGKTWLVRQFAKNMNLTLIEINFEKRPDRADLFESNDPEKILLELSSAFNQLIDPKKCLLFLDEIQAAPLIFSKLRWFAEDCAELPVIAAGSLLEFLLHDHAFSMPVGRITYMYLEPLSFEEFLLAYDKKMLHNYLQQFDFINPIPQSIHDDLLALFREYVVVGGLPAAVSTWLDTKSLSEVSIVHHDILATYRNDFAKYRGRIAIDRLYETMSMVPKLVGKKFVFSRVNKDVQAYSIKQSFELLSRARVCHRVSACSANGVPLAAEIKEKYFKAIFLDVGLCSASLNLNFSNIQSLSDLMMINQGGIAEQVVGQGLRTIDPFFMEPALFYWLRDEVGYHAEIDYVIQHVNKVIPIEVKAGSTGGLKSLHVFMELKNYALAMRINADLPSKAMVSIKSRTGKQVEYTLLSIPFYLIGQISRLLN